MKLKSELYKEEQSEILNKLVHILDLDDNSSVILYELDNDETKQQKILELLPDIRKFFSLSNVRGIKNPETLERPWLSIIRQMSKLKYKMISNDYRVTKDGKKIRTKKYTFHEKYCSNI